MKILLPHLVSVHHVVHCLTLCSSQAAEVTPALKARAPIINAKEAKLQCFHLTNQFARNNMNQLFIMLVEYHAGCHYPNSATAHNSVWALLQRAETNVTAQLNRLSSDRCIQNGGRATGEP